MELRLLSADVDDLVDPDDAAIQKALTELLATSGENSPRAVLLHDNGKDFIQFLAVFGEEITSSRSTESYHLQYCEYHEGKPACFFNEEADFNQIVRIFQVYAKKLHWKGKVAWEPLEKERSTADIVFGCVLILGGSFAAYNFATKGVVQALFGALFCFGIAGLCFYKEFFFQGGYGMPWISGESSCTAGGCGSDGGGGDGGDGGGGCGGGGE